MTFNSTPASPNKIISLFLFPVSVTFVNLNKLLSSKLHSLPIIFSLLSFSLSLLLSVFPPSIVPEIDTGCLICALYSCRGWEHSDEQARWGLPWHYSFRRADKLMQLQMVALNPLFCMMRKEHPTFFLVSSDLLFHFLTLPLVLSFYMLPGDTFRVMLQLILKDENQSAVLSLSYLGKCCSQHNWLRHDNCASDLRQLIPVRRGWSQPATVWCWLVIN